MRRCIHKKDREKEWCEPCFRRESIARSRARGETSLYEYCDVLGRTNG